MQRFRSFIKNIFLFHQHQWWVLWRYWLIREMKIRYAGSSLGVLWAVIQPVATLVIFYVLFGVVLAVKVPGFPADNGYLLHLLAGLAVWLPFSDAVTRGVGCLVAYEDFLRKQPMPTEILPAVSVGGSLVVALVGYTGLMLLSFIYDSFVPSAWFWLPMLITSQLIMMLGITMFASMANFLWRDLGSAAAFIMQIWFYVTPIVYPLSQVDSSYHSWFLLNPLACLVLQLQHELLGVYIPEGTGFALVVWTVLIGFGGVLFFNSMKPALGEAL